MNLAANLDPVMVMRRRALRKARGRRRLVLLASAIGVVMLAVGYYAVRASPIFNVRDVTVTGADPKCRCDDPDDGRAERRRPQPAGGELRVDPERHRGDAGRALGHGRPPISQRAERLGGHVSPGCGRIRRIANIPGGRRCPRDRDRQEESRSGSSRWSCRPAPSWRWARPPPITISARRYGSAIDTRLVQPPVWTNR